MTSPIDRAELYHLTAIRIAHAFCQGALARNAKGDEVSPTSGDAVSFCLLGALVATRTPGRTGAEAAAALRDLAAFVMGETDASRLAPLTQTLATCEDGHFRVAWDARTREQTRGFDIACPVCAARTHRTPSLAKTRRTFS